MIMIGTQENYIVAPPPPKKKKQQQQTNKKQKKREKNVLLPSDKPLILFLSHWPRKRKLQPNVFKTAMKFTIKKLKLHVGYLRSTH